TGTMEDRVIEFVDHLHEHFAEPVVVTGGRYQAPKLPGVGAEMLNDSTARWAFPAGAGWQELNAR
ncbi:MAG: fuconate dehydratase, partial [Actinomycetes bacterium]